MRRRRWPNAGRRHLLPARRQFLRMALRQKLSPKGKPAPPTLLGPLFLRLFPPLLLVTPWTLEQWWSPPSKFPTQPSKFPPMGKFLPLGKFPTLPSKFPRLGKFLPPGKFLPTRHFPRLLPRMQAAAHPMRLHNSPRQGLCPPLLAPLRAVRAVRPANLQACRAVLPRRLQSDPQP